MKGLGKGKSAYEVTFADQYWPGMEQASATREDLGGGGAGIDQICRECPEYSPILELDTWADVVRRKHKKECGCGGACSCVCGKTGGCGNQRRGGVVGSVGEDPDQDRLGSH